MTMTAIEVRQPFMLTQDVCPQHSVVYMSFSIRLGPIRQQLLVYYMIKTNARIYIY